MTSHPSRRTADRVQLGIGLPQARATAPVTPADLRAAVELAEQAGFDSAWTAEGLLGPARAYDPLAMLSFAAACTSTIRLGVAVLVLPLYQPARLARIATTLDHLTDGRLDLGVGVGGRELPFAAFGSDPSGRGDRFEQYVNVLRRLWSEDRVTWSSHETRLEGATIEPKPVQCPLPLWFGGAADVALRRAARLADGWIGAGSVSTGTFAAQLHRLRQSLKDERRDESDFRVAKRAYVSIDRSRAEDRAWFDAVYDGYAPPADALLAGDAEHVLAQLCAIRELGVDLLVINPIGGDLRQIELVAEGILPELRGHC